MTFPILPSNGPSGYNLTRSLRFRSSASAYLNRTIASTSDRQKWTWSGWVKRGTLGLNHIFVASDFISTGSGIRFNSSNQLELFLVYTGTMYWNLITTQVFRDLSAWYHIVVSLDTTQATASNRLRFYVNGTQVTSFSTATYPPLNDTGFINNSTYPQYISRDNTNYFDGYLAEINFIDGQALTPSSFGSTNALTGVWQPAPYTGTYGTNGFELLFTDNSGATATTIGKDFSGNGNNWTPNNISVTAGVTYDSMTDVPTLTSATAANFATLNPLDSSVPITNGNLYANSTVPSAWYDGTCSIHIPSTGKWYFEGTVAIDGKEYIGIALSSLNGLSHSALDSFRTVYGNSGAGGSGTIERDGTGIAATTGLTAMGLNDVVGVAFDASAGTIAFYRNNSLINSTTNSVYANNRWKFYVGVNAAAWQVNFGQRPFSYTPPTGYVALNTYNLPTPTILKGNTVMDATLWTGTGASLSVTNAASFKPDLVWVKSRSAATTNKLTDSVRGVTKGLSSNSTDAESTDTQGLTAFNTNGFTVGTNTDYNNLTATYIAWQWQAGQGSTSSNTNGTITSTVSVNASAGFSVVTYTGTNVSGATIGHGLGVAPSLIIIKNRTSVEAWPVYHSSVGATKYLVLNTTAAEATSSTPWNNTAPTSTVFSLGNWNALNENGSNHVAYCWTPIAGFSAFGSYTGNSSTDGPFVYTGFRPKYLLIRRTDAAASWLVFDSARDTYNAVTKLLRPNLADAEATSADVALDFLSNGFKLRQTSNNINTGTIIYAAYASNPFKNSLAF